MNIKMFSTTVLLTQCLVFPTYAQVGRAVLSAAEPQAAARGNFIASHNSVATATPNSSAVADLTTANSEVFRSVYIGLGKSVALDSKLDYSSSDTVAIGFQCIICDTSANSLGTSGLVLQAQWTVPDASLFVTTENKGSNTFIYWDSGGAIFNVYGSQFRLTLQNKGKQPIAIEQITLFRRRN